MIYTLLSMFRLELLTYIMLSIFFSLGIKMIWWCQKKKTKRCKSRKDRSQEELDKYELKGNRFRSYLKCMRKHVWIVKILFLGLEIAWFCILDYHDFMDLIFEHKCVYVWYVWFVIIKRGKLLIYEVDLNRIKVDLWDWMLKNN